MERDDKQTFNVAAGTVVDIPVSFVEVLPLAIVRLRYLYPAMDFKIVSDGLFISGPSCTREIQRDVLHAVYREKVYQDTLPMRRSLMEKLMR